ncbi:hypothetical protein RDI58_001776 [Solanum bulbocastanum]|uniref:Uncharacterized protein n=1 Tax=Solanum bulbocastanum TaxID=147425 RepID=A0AAN8U388_SOLBU
MILLRDHLFQSAVTSRSTALGQLDVYQHRFPYFFVNGKICKDPKFATPNDFFASGLNVSGTAVVQCPGLALLLSF